MLHLIGGEPIAVVVVVVVRLPVVVDIASVVRVVVVEGTRGNAEFNPRKIILSTPSFYLRGFILILKDQLISIHSIVQAIHLRFNQPG